jgi:protocatechuate 3,4-dioxygenase beta subunit
MVIVGKVTPVITVTGGEVDYEEVATVNVTVMAGETPVAGNAVVTVNGVDYAVTIGADGRGFVDIENLPFGEYPITAKFLENDYYEAADYAGDAKVIVKVPDEVIMELALNDDNTVVDVSAVNPAGEVLDGYIMGELFKDGEKFANLDFAYLTDGIGALNIPADLGAGEYTVMVTVLTDTGAMASENISFIVERKSGVQVDASAEDYAFSETGSLVITVTDADGKPLNGTAYVEIDGEIYTATGEVINGQATVDLTGLDIGAHVAKVTFSNPDYLEAEFTTHFNVTKVATTVEVNDTTAEWNTPVSIPIKVTGADGKPVTGTVIVCVDWHVDGAYYVAELNENGEAEANYVINQAIGDLTITATFIGNDNYTTSKATATLTITESTDLEIEVTANEPDFGEDTIITVTATDGAGAQITVEKVNVTIGDETKELPVGEDGTVNLGKLPVGETEITVSVDDGVHKATETAINVTVSPAPGAQITVNVEDYFIDETGKLVVTVTDVNGNPLDGSLYVEIDDELYLLGGTITGGEATINLANLEVGKHSVKVTFDNASYLPVEGQDHFEVSYHTGIIVDANAADYAFGKTGSLVITVTDVDDEPMNGTAYVEIDGETYAIDIEVIDGQATVELKDIAVGEHSAKVTFANDTYLPVEFTTHFNVTKVTPVMTVTGSTVEYGSPSTVDIKVTDEDGNPVTGTVIVGVDWIADGAYDVVELDENGEGQASLRLDLLGVAPGTYDVNATFIGDDIYAAVEDTSAKVTIKESTELNVEVSVNEPVEGEDVIFNITATDGTGAEVPVAAVNVTIDGVTTEYPVDENGTVNIGALPAGETEVTISIDDGVHTPVSETKTVTVTLPELIQSVLTVTATNISYGDKAVIEFTLKDINDNPITGDIHVTIGDREETVKVENGVGTVTIEDLAADTYAVVAAFDGDSTYDASVGNTYFNVAQNATVLVYSDMTTTAINPNVDGREGEYFYVVLKDANGNPIANKTVQIGFNGKIYNRTTNESGRVRLQINLGTVNWYTFAICFLGDENYTSAFEIAKITVEPQTPKLTVPNKSYSASAKTKTLTATFKSSRGNPVSGRKVTFTVNGKTYSATTDSSGVAKANVSLTTKGTYTVTTKFAGDTTYGAVTKTSTLKLT